MASKKALEPGLGIQQNWERAMLFLNLTLEQAREINKNAAHTIEEIYIKGLQQEFESLFANADARGVDAPSLSGERFWEYIVETNAKASRPASASAARPGAVAPPPGIGYPSHIYNPDDTYKEVQKAHHAPSHREADSGVEMTQQYRWNAPIAMSKPSELKYPPGLQKTNANFASSSADPLSSARGNVAHRAVSDGYYGAIGESGSSTTSRRRATDSRDYGFTKAAGSETSDTGYLSTHGSSEYQYAQPPSTSAAPTIQRPLTAHRSNLVDSAEFPTLRTKTQHDSPVEPKKTMNDEHMRLHLESRGYIITKPKPAEIQSPADDAKPVCAQPATKKSGPLNWAQIAAIGSGTDNANAKSGIARPPPFLKAPVMPSAKKEAAHDDADDLLPASSIPVDPACESYPQALRVVWISGLPSGYGIGQVSSKIREGALLSISFLQDAAPHMPGKSACVIFQNAMDAVHFLYANGCSITLYPATEAGNVQATEGEVVDNRPAPLVQQSTGSENRFVSSKDAPRAKLTLGGSYPHSASPFLEAMDLHRVRRRLKWARKGLFHQTNLYGFKRDVIRLAGGLDKIELFHFFNNGECTVVFDSVQTAIVVKSGFEAWGEGKKLPAEISDMVARKRSPTMTASQFILPKATQGGIGKGGKGSAQIKKPAPVAPPKATASFPSGRYEGVDVAYCKDFNEDPCARLVSVYGSGNNVSGMAGVFQGPRMTEDKI